MRPSGVSSVLAAARRPMLRVASGKAEDVHASDLPRAATSRRAFCACSASGGSLKRRRYMDSVQCVTGTAAATSSGAKPGSFYLTGESPKAPGMPRFNSHSSRLQHPASSSPPSEKGEAGLPSQPPESLPFYNLFPRTLPLGPPPRGSFELDGRVLRTEFLQLQAAAHPDFHHQARHGSDGSVNESSISSNNSKSTRSAARDRAEAASSLINEAYRTLLSPLLRAQYLLKHLYGIDLAGDESTLWSGKGGGGDGAGGGGGETKSDTELLMTVLEVREEIEQAASEEDLEPLRLANNDRMRASEAALASAFATTDVSTAGREAVRLRYWVNIDDSLRNWERGKEILLEH